MPHFDCYGKVTEVYVTQPEPSFKVLTFIISITSSFHEERGRCRQRPPKGLHELMFKVLRRTRFGRQD